MLNLLPCDVESEPEEHEFKPIRIQRGGLICSIVSHCSLQVIKLYSHEKSGSANDSLFF
jgi:hypothetical protein